MLIALGMTVTLVATYQSLQPDADRSFNLGVSILGAISLGAALWMTWGNHETPRRVSWLIALLMQLAVALYLVFLAT
jgi:hypothetical protein